MKIIVSILAFLMCFNAFAGPTGGASTIPSLTVGGRVFTDLANLKTFQCYTTAANGFCTARVPGASSGYQVTTGKTLTLYAIQMTNNATTTTEIACQLRYTDNDLGLASSSAGTNPIQECNGGACHRNNLGGSPFIAQDPTLFSVPSQKYVGVNCSGTGDHSIVMFGYEQ